MRSLGAFDSHRDRRPILTLAVGLTAAAGIIGAIAIVTSRSQQRPQEAGAPSSAPTLSTGVATGVPVTTATKGETVLPASPATTTPAPVAFMCGADFPVDVLVPNAVATQPATLTVDPPPVAGQLSEVWTVAGGAIDLRWPADERVVYAVDGRDDPNVVQDLAVSVPADGSFVEVKSDMFDSASSGSGFMMKLSATPASYGLEGPCDVIQVRYIANDGRRSTTGFQVDDLAKFPLDLNPVISSTTEVAKAPSESLVALCTGQTEVGHTVELPVIADTPAGALLAFLERESTPLSRSGYQELRVTADGTYVYEIINSNNLVTLIAVTNHETGWAVDRWAASAC